MKLVNDNLRYFDSIAHELPLGMAAFGKYRWHDSTVLSIDRPSHDTFAMIVDSHYCPYAPQGVYKVEFMSVKLVEGTEGMVGSDGIWQEVELQPEAGFEFCVLFRNSDFRISLTTLSLLRSIPSQRRKFIGQLPSCSTM